MTSKARNLADLGNVYDDGALSNRNLIINGAMQVAQRGTSFTANGYGIDRYITYNSGGTATLTQENLAAGDSLANGSIHHYMRVVRASPSGIYYISNKIEDVKTAAGETVTFSFYAKASASVSLGVRLTQDFGSGGSSTVDAPETPSATLTTSWQRYTMSFSVPSVLGKTIGTNSNLQATFDIPASTETFDITGVQLEVGDTATPFEHRSFGDELARCQRYLWRGGFAGAGVWGGGGTLPLIGHTFPVAMRATPTTTWVSGGIASNGSADYSITGLNSVQGSSNLSQRLLLTVSGNAGGNGIGCDVFGATMSFDAEL